MLDTDIIHEKSSRKRISKIKRIQLKRNYEKLKHNHLTNVYLTNNRTERVEKCNQYTSERRKKCVNKYQEVIKYETSRANETYEDRPGRR